MLPRHLHAVSRNTSSSSSPKYVLQHAHTRTIAAFAAAVNCRPSKLLRSQSGIDALGRNTGRLCGTKSVSTVDSTDSLSDWRSDISFYETLKNETAKLEYRAKHLTRWNDPLEQKEAECRAILDSMKHRESEVHQRWSQVEQQRSELAEQHQQLKQQMAALRAGQEQVDRDKQGIAQKRTQLQQQLVALQQQVTSAQATLERERTQLREQQSECEQRSKSLLENERRLNNKLTDINAKRNEVENDRMRLRTQRSALEKRERTQSEIESGTQALLQREQETLAKVAPIEALQTEVHEQQQQLQRDLHSFRRQQQDLNEQRVQQQQIKQQLSEQLSQWQKTLDDKHAKLEAYGEQIVQKMDAFNADKYRVSRLALDEQQQLIERKQAQIAPVQREPELHQLQHTDVVGREQNFYKYI